MQTQAKSSPISVVLPQAPFETAQLCHPIAALRVASCAVTHTIYTSILALLPAQATNRQLRIEYAVCSTPGCQGSAVNINACFTRCHG